jgi:anti-sigma-K factor RskA
MTHSEMDELYELFVLRTLEREIASEIEQHLRDGCTHCESKIAKATVLMAAFAETVEITPAPPGLKDRVLSSVRPSSSARRGNRSSTVYALAGLCAALVAVCVWLGTETSSMNSRLNEAARERNALEAALKSLSRSGTRTIQFGKANQPEGKVFVNPSGGLVFVAARLPRLSHDHTFQLWLVPPTGAPRSAALFRPDENGSSVTVSNVAVDPATTKAVAVSVEPASGSSAPTTTPIIVAALE